MIKIIIVDDHKIFREGLAFILSKWKDIKVIAEAENGKVFLDILKKKKPDIVLMDIDMPIIDGIKATEKAMETYPDLKVIALSMKGDENSYYGMIHAGAKGFVLKEAGSEQLRNAIDYVLQDVSFFTPELASNLIAALKARNKTIELEVKKPSIKLTKREQEVLTLISKGHTIKDIAKQLVISPRTVEGHKSKIMEKLGAKNTSNLIILAIKNNLIKIIT